MTHLHRIAGIGVLGLVAWSAACANHDTACVAPYHGCGNPEVCCQGDCNGDTCMTPPSQSSGAASSGDPFNRPKDPECAKEQFPTRTKFCASLGKCIDPTTDDKNCGECGNVCGQDTNDIPLHCFQGQCE